MGNNKNKKRKKDDNDIYDIIKKRFKTMEEVRDLIDVDGGGMVKIREGSAFREVTRGGWLHVNYVNKLEEEIGRKLSIDLFGMTYPK